MLRRKPQSRRFIGLASVMGGHSSVEMQTEPALSDGKISGLLPGHPLWPQAADDQTVSSKVKTCLDQLEIFVELYYKSSCQ